MCEVVAGCLDEMGEDVVAQTRVVYFAIGLQVALEHHWGRLLSKPTVATTLGAQ